MTDFHDRLAKLIADACQHSPDSTERRVRLTQVIRLVGPKLWNERTLYYDDALQQTWLHFCRNVCESNTGRQYDPSRSSVVTWLNNYLRFRLKDAASLQREQSAKNAPSYTDSKSGSTLNPVEQIAAPEDIPPILRAVQAWAEADEDGELCRLHIAGHPQITAQQLILRRLPPETSWKDLAQAYGVGVSTLSSFYQRKCLPRLRNFGQSEGYLE